ncbi:MAG: hypothetical protein ABSA78_04395 [Candidatus Sulfotelmatobacter sp.]|jgi:hypothetical protein
MSEKDAGVRKVVTELRPHAIWEVVRWGVPILGSAMIAAFGATWREAVHVPVWRLFGALFLASFVVFAALLYLARRAEPWTRHSQLVNLCFQHRTNNNELFRSAFRGSGDVYLLTIKSRNVLSVIDKLLEDLPASVQLNVLTWDPGSPKDKSNAGIRALHRLTRDAPEDPEGFTSEVLAAPEGWTRRAKSRPNIEVRLYESAPTMEGVLVKDKWVVVEVMPFGVPTADRPGLVLNADKEPESFAIFQKAFIDLWRNSKKI